MGLVTACLVQRASVRSQYRTRGMPLIALQHVTAEIFAALAIVPAKDAHTDLARIRLSILRLCRQAVAHAPLDSRAEGVQIVEAVQCGL